MPQKAEESPEELIEIFKKYAIFNRHELKPSKDKIWTDIKHENQLQMKATSLHLIIHENRYKSKEVLEFYFRIDSQASKIRNKIEKDKDYDEIELRNPFGCDKIALKLQIPGNQLIKNLETKEKNANWSNNLAKAVFDAKNLPCAFAFTHGYVTSEDFIFKGSCSTCHSGIYGRGSHGNEVVIINVLTFDTIKLQHNNKKRKLTREDRKKTQKKLCFQTVAAFKNDNLGEKISDKKLLAYELPLIRPHELHDSVVLQKARGEGLDIQIHFYKYKGKSINNKDFIRICSIRWLSLSPFYVFYWSDRQTKLWNNIYDEFLPASFDATGSLARKYSFYQEEKCKSLFYYVLTVGFEKKIIPVFQAILSIHHVDIIKKLFDTWLESGAEIPKVISTDGSLVLQNAINLSCNGLTFKGYNLKCHKILMDQENISTLNTFYRQDVYHLVHDTKNWDCLKVFEEKDFFVRSICYLFEVADLRTFEKVLSDIIIVANSFETDESSPN